MFIRGPNPIWFFSDLVGQPVDDTYFAFFLENVSPYLPQPVYVTPNGTLWSNPIEFQPSSGLPDNIYFDPDLVYRIEIRQGPDSSFPLIYLIQNYTISGTGGGGGGGAIPLDTSENIITNPQFADIYFSSPLTINTAGTTHIAPGWDLITSGAGQTVITQIPYAGTNNSFANPPYSLTFTSSGWGSVFLVQRLHNNGAIFNKGAVAGSITAFSTGAQTQLTLSYVPSDGGTAKQILSSVQILLGTFAEYKNAINITGDSTNSDIPPAAYVDIQFTLPIGTITLTNIQVTGQTAPLADPNNFVAPSFQQQTYERIVDHEFHVYRDSLLTQSKNNILVGWTFALNPWQFTNPAISNVAANQYTADQTIVVQQNFVATGTGNNVAVGRGTFAQNYALSVTAVTATNQFAIIQYIDPSTIRPYWNQILSVMVNLSMTTNTMPLFKVRLIYSGALPLTIGQNEPILTWANSTPGSPTEPSYSPAWGVPIKPLNDPSYTIQTLAQGFPFDQFQLPADPTGLTVLGIVIYTTTNLNIGDTILFNRVSLVPNDFAIDASTETFDETLRKCQFYYEKSYNIDVIPGVAPLPVTDSGFDSFQTLANTTALRGINSRFKVNKRASPIMIWYSPTTGASNNVANLTSGMDASISSTSATGTSSTGFPNAGSSQGIANIITAQWAANARLGG